MNNHVQDVLGVSMEKIKEMVDVDTVIGTPIVSGAVTIIPVSRVSYGFAGGGSDLPAKQTQPLFGGGAGAGITVTPIAFLSIADDKVSVLPLLSKPDTVDSLISKLPEVADTISALIAKWRKPKEKAPDQTAEA